MTSLGEALVPVLREARALIEAQPQGPTRDQMQGQYDRMIQRLRGLPDRIAAHEPFASDAEAREVVTREFDFVVSAFSTGN